MEFVKTELEKDGMIGKIRINRPEKLNALDGQTVQELHRRFNACEKDPKIKLIILLGTGEKAFCAGGDIKEIYEVEQETGRFPIDYFGEEFLLDKLVYHSDKIILSYTHGVTMGGGIGLSIGGDFIVTDETTKWAMPETALGLFPDVGVGYYFSRLPQAEALYLSLLGETITGVDAVELGLSTHYIKSEDWDIIYQDILSLKDSSLSTRDLKKEVKDILDRYIVEEKETKFQKNREAIKAFFSEDSLEKIVDKLKLGSSDFAKESYKTIQEKCPVALQLVFYKYFAGKKWTREETFERDKELLIYCNKYGNMNEGIRSMMIDKDHNPKFSPSNLEEVDTEEIKELMK